MIKFNKKKLSSVQGVFILYMLASSAVILVFNLIYPGETAPLAYFSWRWRFLQGSLDIMNLFPALALSALTVPFGIKFWPMEKFAAFSPQFLKSIRGSILTAIAAAAIYAAIFLLVLPLVRDYQADLRYQGRLYRISKQEAQNYAAEGQWAEAAQFLGICEQIWPGGPEVAKLKAESDIRNEEIRMKRVSSSLENRHERVKGTLPGEVPLTAAEAMALAEKALREERFYDAHWLAALAERLAGTGSAETASAVQLASRAWNAISSMAPTARESEAYRLYRLKRDGYEALAGEDWIRAYYIFLELLSFTPNDPDAEKYFRMSEEGCSRTAFFVDEMDLATGGIITGAVFSLPLGLGRMVMRLSSLTIFSDSAYGIGAEIFAFDRDARPAWRMEVPYIKFLPLSLENETRTTMLFRALDRVDKDLRWEPIVQGMGEAPPEGPLLNLNLAWKDFLLLVDLRRGVDNLPVQDLIGAANAVGNFGHLPQIFQAEFIHRIARLILFLPLAIFILILGWRYRAMKRPRYWAYLMMGILPVVMHGLVQFARSWVNNIGIWSVITLGFSGAIIAFAAGSFVLLVLSLIILAAQNG
jgi:hypothetical protein